MGIDVDQRDSCETHLGFLHVHTCRKRRIMSAPIIPLDIGNGARVLPPSAPEPSTVSISEDATFYEIRTALPGFDAENVIVAVSGDVVTIAAKACGQTHSVLGSFFTIDHRVTLVEQSFALPPDADAHNLTTTLQDGVLSILVARTPVSNVVVFPTR